MTNTEQEVSLRKAVPGDVEAIAALTDAAYSKYIALIGRKPQPMSADYARMVAENAIWLLFAGEQLAGVLVLVFEAEELLIYSVAINPEFQHQGLGRRLMAWAESQAAQEGYTSIRLYTNELFVDNIRLYKRLGYQETGREAYLNSTLVHMKKKL